MPEFEALKMTDTCAKVIRYFAGDRTATAGMRGDVFGKAETRSRRAGWLESIDAWPHTGVTDAGREAITNP